MIVKCVRIDLLCCIVIMLSVSAIRGEGRETVAEMKQEIGELVAWNSQEGMKRLSRANATDFYQLAHRFQPQENPLYCGIATSVIVLNAFRQGNCRAPSQPDVEVKKPEAFDGGVIPFPAYSQRTFLNEKTDQVKSRAIIRLENISLENTNDSQAFNPGLSLKELSEILEVYDLKVARIHAEGKNTVEKFRSDIISTIDKPLCFLVCNFVGKKIGTTTGGHISPIAAYDKITDSVLVLDVAGHKNPWYWVEVEKLYGAMKTKDGKKNRGWIIIAESKS